MSRTTRRAGLAVLGILAILATTVAPGGAQGPAPDGRWDHQFATPLLGANVVPDTNLVMAADAAAGIVRVARNSSTLLTELPLVSDVLPMSRARGFAVAGSAPPEEEPAPEGQAALGGAMPQPNTVYVYRGDHLRELADFGAREARLNPDGAEIDSNGFRLARIRGVLGVSDAGANTLWGVRIGTGRVRVIATFPGSLVDTQWLKDLVGCPDAPAEALELCDLPPQIFAQSVPTGLAVGPDGMWYIGELRGFGAGPGEARVWRVPAGTWNADCSVDPRCEVVADGFTSIVDLAFTTDGRLVVTEMDEATFLAAEFGIGVGGAIWVCELELETCDAFATGLPLITAAAVGRGDRVFAVIFGLVPGSADIVSLGRIPS